MNILSCLKSKQSLQDSKPSKVRFHEPSSTEDQPTDVKTKKCIQKSDVDVTLLYGGRLLRTVSKVVCLCLERIWSNTSETDLVLATELIKVFFSESLLSNILIKLNSISAKDDLVKSSCDTSRAAVCLCCIDELVLPLLDKKCHNVNEKWLSCVVQLFFTFLVELEENEQKSVLERIFQVFIKVVCQESCGIDIGW